MLSITKVKSAAGGKKGGYSAYLDHLDDAHAFDAYARSHELGGPLPFWFGSATAELGLSARARASEVQKLAEGLHPSSGLPLVQGAGRAHVMGADLTFSCPKDVSVLFAGSDSKMQAQIVKAMHASVSEALGYAQSIAITRHGKGGAIKQLAKSVVACVYTHFASRALDPQLHAHAFLFNVGQRQDGTWSALEHKAQFENQKATGILFRVELAHRLRNLGFQIDAVDGLFTVQGISHEQRGALSKRSAQLHEALKSQGLGNDAASKQAAALATRGHKDEPPLNDLIAKFSNDAAALGITPTFIQSLRGVAPVQQEFRIDHQELLDDLTASSSVLTRQELLRAICTRAMDQWSAARCLQELTQLTQSPLLVHLGATSTLTQVYTSKRMLVLESDISQQVALGAVSTAHQTAAAKVDAAFDVLQKDLTQRIGVAVNLDEQRQAAHHICNQTGVHAFVEGWAGTGKTTLLKAVGQVYRDAGFSLIGTALSGAAALNLERETDIRSNTLAGLLLSIEHGTMKLTSKSIVVLDEAGLVGSREFSMLQKHVVAAGAKLVCIGDPKQLQPIEAGGIFKSLIDKHGAAQVSRIQRQKTDFAPLLTYLTSTGSRGIPALFKEQAQALWRAPEDARIRALEHMAKADEKVARALTRWKARFDHQWLRVAVAKLAVGEAREALDLLNDRGCLLMLESKTQAHEALISAWSAHKAQVRDKAIIAPTRADVFALNTLARLALIKQGAVNDSQGIEAHVILKDEAQETRRFAPGDRIVFTKNDRIMDTTNGMQGTVQKIDLLPGGPHIVIQLDEASKGGRQLISVPAVFGHLDHAYCLTNHKAQGKTVDTAFVFIDPLLANRQWCYVAASRSKHSTQLFVDESALHSTDFEAHQHGNKTQVSSLDRLATFMKRSQSKGTSLDYEVGPADIDMNQVKRLKNLFSRLMAKNNKSKEATHEPQYSP